MPVSVFEKKRHGSLEVRAAKSAAHGWKRFVKGPSTVNLGWALFLNAAEFCYLGIGWSSVGRDFCACSLGCKSCCFAGVDVSAWGYWQQSGNAKAFGKFIVA